MLRICVIGTGRLGTALIRSFHAFAKAQPAAEKVGDASALAKAQPAAVKLGDASTSANVAKTKPDHDGVIDKLAPFRPTQTSNIALSYFSNSDEYVSDVAGRLENLEQLEADVVILAVPDRAIATVAADLPEDVLAIHTSGATEIERLPHGRRAVLWPLDSFGKDMPVGCFKDTPWFVQTENASDLKILNHIVAVLGGTIRQASLMQRQRYHLAAVWANNFTNHLLTESLDVLSEDDLDPEALLPILTKTFEQMRRLKPRDTQSGPAVRKDDTTLSRHLSLMDAKQARLYRLLSQRIQDAHDKL